MRNPDQLGWPLLGATALAAMVSGHAIELWLENLHLFGEGRANYTHPVQMFALETAAILFAAVASVVVWRIFQCALDRRAANWRNVRGATHKRSDSVLPALGSIAHLGIARVTVSLLAVQFGSLIATELLEQRLAGFNGGIADVIGPAHASAILVHLVIGFIFAFALYRAARFICTATRTIVGALVIFLRRTFECVDPAVHALRIANLAAFGPKPPLLSLGLANRPPPVALATIA